MLEIACFNVESALIAANAGADRIELCADITTGGITPLLEDFISLKNKVTIPIYVMIRPRGGDFVYNEEERNQMITAITLFKKAAVDGFVFGALTQDNEIDIDSNKSLVALANPLPCTFHRAFDVTANYSDSLEKTIQCGFTNILTSGSTANALDGKEVLANLIIQAGNRINIICGGGVRSTNLPEIKQHTNGNYFHSAAITDDSAIANGEEIKKLKRVMGDGASTSSATSDNGFWKAEFRI